MKKFHHSIAAVLLLPWVFGVSGCGPKHEAEDGHDHPTQPAASEKTKESHEDHGDENPGATYQEGKGINLSEETRQSLGLELAKVSKQELTPTLSLTAQIYRAATETSRIHGGERSGNAYAMALIPMELKGKLVSGGGLSFTPKNENNSPREGTMWKIDSTPTALLGKTEVLLELPDREHRLAVGDFVEVKIPLGEKRETLAIPRLALLETSTGTFAFVRNGDFLLRTEIKTGTQTDDSVEITSGLHESDTIVVKPVQSLYLIELRATKGGGHSH